MSRSAGLVLVPDVWPLSMPIITYMVVLVWAYVLATVSAPIVRLYKGLGGGIYAFYLLGGIELCLFN